MTRRERLESKLERRREWAEKASQRCSAEFETARKITEGIPFGQPILVGHHSEGAHRRAIERSAGHMDKGCEEYDKAKHHEAKAEGLARQLETTIFSDDPNAVEALQAKIAELERWQEQAKATNKILRGKGTDEEKAQQLVQQLGINMVAAIAQLTRGPVPGYALTNNNANLRRYKQRLVQVQAAQKRQQAAEAAPNGVCIETLANGWCRVTFAEKPEREVLNALRGAGFYWHGGCWHGEKSKLPAQVEELAK